MNPLLAYAVSLFTASLDESTDFEIRRKVILVNVTMLIGTAALVLYASLAFVQDYFFVGLIDVVSAVVLFGTFLYLRISKNQLFATYISTTYMVGVLLYLLLSGGVSGTGALWSYTVPVFVMFMLGSLWGSAVSLSYLAFIMTVFILSPPVLLSYDYPPDFRGRFVGVYLTIYALALVFENTRALTHRRFEQRERMIEKAMAELHSSTEALRTSEKRYADFVSSFQGIAFRGRHGEPPELFSGMVERVCGYAPEDILEGRVRWDGLVSPDDQGRYRSAMRRVLSKPGSATEHEYRILTRAGKTRWIRETVQSAQSDGELWLQGAIYDTTEQKKLAESMRQSQKMESIGQLAGGIAHDFNNQLAVILGYANLISRKSEGDSLARRFADRIATAARRSSDLTSQLLAFARKGKYRMEAVNVHEVIAEVIALLHHSIDKRIRTVEHLDAEHAVVVGDPSLLQNALLNIALNARDAMPDGGTLTFTTSCVVLEREQVRKLPYSIPPGAYLQVLVTDTGSGMDEETARHAFEPFYTTKDVGKGTGMGLAAVYGTVKSHSGAVEIDSQPGVGTTITVNLPLASAASAEEDTSIMEPSSLNISSSVLVVDDEELVREMAADMLTSLGHRVETVGGGREAVVLIREHPGQFGVVLLDLVMDDLDGIETFHLIRQLDPEMPVIISSGYSLEERARQLAGEERVTYVQKPYDQDQLSAAVTAALTPA